MSEWNMDDEGNTEVLFNDSHLVVTEPDSKPVESIGDIVSQLDTLQDMFISQAFNKFDNMVQEYYHEEIYSSCYTYL